jgi:hypothetical protein
MELLIGFLRNPKFKVRPILQALKDHLLPLSKHGEWGPLVPCNITGQFNQHPRDAMAHRAAGFTPAGRRCDGTLHREEDSPRSRLTTKSTEDTKKGPMI